MQVSLQQQLCKFDISLILGTQEIKVTFVASSIFEDDLRNKLQNKMEKLSFKYLGLSLSFKGAPSLTLSFDLHILCPAGTS